MRSQYDLIASKDGLNYQFTTDSGDTYIAYFTEFYLESKKHEEVQIFSFGFDRRKSNKDIASRYDSRIKATIIHILDEFFKRNSDNAILYICLTEDGMSRNRRITFGRWFNEIGAEYIKYDSHIKYEQDSFYSSIIIRNDNLKKDYIIESFKFTVNYWMGE